MALLINRPLVPMLSRPASSLPVGSGWLYEPKYDGFRAVVYRDERRVYIDSRNGKPLGPYFPELLEALADALPDSCVVDGEIVACSSDGLDFEQLSSRLHPSRYDEKKANGTASFIAFDLLAGGRSDLLGQPFRRRRELLERVVREGPTVVVTPQTNDARAAESWLAGIGKIGIEGVVAKRAASTYEPGRRVMVKVRRQRLIDCVIGGFVPSQDGSPIALVLGLYDRCGVLHHIGQTSLLSAERRVDAVRLIRRYAGGRSFGAGRMPGRSRWSEQRDLIWHPVRPGLVCEVAVSNIDNFRFRHGATLVRWRFDKHPTDCTYSQLS